MSAVFSKIVVPYDHSPLSQKALDTAINLAGQDKSIVLNVVTVINLSMPVDYYTALDVEAEFKSYSNKAKEILAEAEQRMKDLPNESETFILEGNPAEMIVEFVKLNHADLVVMGSRGLSGLKELFLGSVSHNVVQKSPCPVWIIK